MEENGSLTGQGDGVGIEERRGIEMKILELKRAKRSRKTAVTRIRHAQEKLCAKKGEINVEIIEKEIDGLWGVLEKCLAIIDELCYMYLQIG